MNFEEYLIEKKINSALFRQGNPELWEEFNRLFNEMHPKSFTAQKLFLINNIRRQYLLAEMDGVRTNQIDKMAKPAVEVDNAKSETKKPARPVMKRPKIK